MTDRINRPRRAALFAALAFAVAAGGSGGAAAAECAVLLHGLARSAASMENMGAALSRAGYVVVNVGYPSRRHSARELAEMAVGAGLRQCAGKGAAPVNFVTHSLGGVLLRQYFAARPPIGVRRAVMLAPPNRGSEVVDKLRDMPGFLWLNGPAGLSLGTESDSAPNSLGSAPFETGIIAGDRSINFFLSALLPGADDGKVAVERTKLDGMRDFIVLPTAHPFIMDNATAISETLLFLRNGRFSPAAPRR